MGLEGFGRLCRLYGSLNGGIRVPFKGSIGILGFL